MHRNMPTDEPRITADITFLRTDEGGRQTAPQFPGYWFLHIVIQRPGVRQANVQGHQFQEHYHPLRIVEAPASYDLGQSASFVLTPMYYAQDPFAELKAGVTFTAHEGARIVAHGVVLSRADPV